MARGDYPEMARLQQEMTGKAYQVGAQGMEAQSVLTIRSSIALNESGGATIDPDKIVVEKPGVIGLKEKDDEDDAKITLYFDLVSLKDTKSVSRVEFPRLAKGAAKKTALMTAVVTLEGPLKDVEAWVKKIDVKAVLAQLH